MRRSVLLVTALAVVLGAAPACSDKTDGSPLAGGDTTGNQSGSTTTTSKGNTSTRSTSGNPTLAGKDPCSLLTASAQSKLGISNGSKHDVGSARGCRWTQDTQSGDTYVFDLGIRDRAGIKDIPADAGPKPLSDIGSHKAVQTSGLAGPGSCQVILGVTDSSRVEAGLITGKDPQKACDLALQMAKLVEPELP